MRIELVVPVSRRVVGCAFDDERTRGRGAVHHLRRLDLARREVKLLFLAEIGYGETRQEDGAHAKGSRPERHKGQAEEVDAEEHLAPVGVAREQQKGRARKTDKAPVGARGPPKTLVQMFEHA